MNYEFDILIMDEIEDKLWIGNKIYVYNVCTLVLICFIVVH